MNVKHIFQLLAISINNGVSLFFVSIGISTNTSPTNIGTVLCCVTIPKCIKATPNNKIYISATRMVLPNIPIVRTAKYNSIFKNLQETPTVSLTVDDASTKCR